MECQSRLASRFIGTVRWKLFVFVAHRRGVHTRQPARATRQTVFPTWRKAMRRDHVLALTGSGTGKCYDCCGHSLETFFWQLPW